MEIRCLYGRSLGPHCSFCHKAESHYVIDITYDDTSTLICEECLSVMNEKFKESADKAASRMLDIFEEELQV